MKKHPFFIVLLLLVGIFAQVNAQTPGFVFEPELIKNHGISSLVIYVDTAQSKYDFPAFSVWEARFDKYGKVRYSASYVKEVVIIKSVEVHHPFDSTEIIYRIDSSFGGLDYMHTMDTFAVVKKFKQGKIISEDFQLLDMPELFQKSTLYSYTHSGKLEMITVHEKSVFREVDKREKTQYFYDKKDQLIKKETWNTGAKGGDELFEASLYERKKRGRLLIERLSQKDNNGKSVLTIIERRKDKEGKLVEVVKTKPSFFSSSKWTYSYTEDGLPLAETRYDAKGNVLYRFVVAYQKR